MTGVETTVHAILVEYACTLFLHNVHVMTATVVHYKVNKRSLTFYSLEAKLANVHSDFRRTEPAIPALSLIICYLFN